jgi:hypothetical protein
MWSSYLNHLQSGPANLARHAKACSAQRNAPRTKPNTARPLRSVATNRTDPYVPHRQESNSSRAQTANNPTASHDPSLPPRTPRTHATVPRDGTDPTPLALVCPRPFPSPPTFSARPPATPDARLILGDRRRPPPGPQWAAAGSRDSEGGGIRLTLGFPPMDGDENRGFKASFTGEGQALLNGRVKEKLKELMGDYSDDTLAVSAARSPPSIRC